MINSINDSLSFSQTSILGVLRHKEIDTSHRTLYSKLVDLKTGRSCSRHTEEQIKSALQITLPYIDLSLITVCIAAAVEQGKQPEEIWPILISDKWNEICDQSECYTAKLKRSSLMYVFVYYYPSLEVLSSLTGTVRFTSCRCYRDSIVHPVDNGILESVPESNAITTKSSEELHYTLRILLANREECHSYSFVL